MKKIDAGMTIFFIQDKVCGKVYDTESIGKVIDIVPSHILSFFNSHKDTYVVVQWEDDLWTTEITNRSISPTDAYIIVEDEKQLLALRLKY